MLNVLIIGSAGFVGYHTSIFFLKKKYNVIGIDNIDNYYDIELKKNRIRSIKKQFDNYFFEKIDIKNKNKLNYLFETYKFDLVIHFAAQPGIRASILNPQKVFDNNMCTLISFRMKLNTTSFP